MANITNMANLANVDLASEKEIASLKERIQALEVAFAKSLQMYNKHIVDLHINKVNQTQQL